MTGAGGFTPGDEGEVTVTGGGLTVAEEGQVTVAGGLAVGEEGAGVTGATTTSCVSPSLIKRNNYCNNKNLQI